ncbi:thioesterase family protein [Lachnoanaerobaculum sp. MSX33]|jgi:thioesterase superfamily protein|uniref:thioesterase family protein n=1 Tax=Lachnoanaerobaculum TaxID=1164882 RepID=UPI0003DF8764|nr:MULTISPECIES: thioesterase family protein [unclassified Lachnoanaerobaculum]ETO97475.1 thioesterase family protein [Lachnoanaerobaculum sp. MSX33]GMO03099.1 thioesterase family protein [Lachnoanaerobaculum sp. JCM 36186]
MLEVGIKGQRETIVTKENTAAGIGSGSLEVFSTPMMILLMEESCFMSVNDILEEGFTTVGTCVNVKHLSATPLGMKVVIKSELINVDGRALTFKVEAYDEKGLIGEGIHERFIVNNEKFQAKTDSKLDK